MANRIIGKVAINPCGEWKEHTVYERLDFVTYKKNSYLCKKDYDSSDEILPTNTEYWMQVSSSIVGNQGTHGTQGTQGNQGRQGTQGFQGVRGFQGVQGLQGTQGNQGNKGAQGVQGRGGVQGDHGMQGNQGKQGTVGSMGNRGVMGYQGNQGNIGNMGWQGYQGRQGFRGEQGRVGEQGIRGAQGSQGYQGRQGVQGAFGNLGPQGNQGNQGKQGNQGNQGKQGVMGTAGDVFVPEVTGENMVTWKRRSYTDTTTEKSFDFGVNFYFYGYTNGVIVTGEPLNDIGKDETLEHFKGRSPKPAGTPITLMGDPGAATDEMRFIWKRKINAKTTDAWELLYAKYVSLAEVVESSISNPIINVSLAYGSVVIDTDLTWGIFELNKGGTDYSSEAALTFKPTWVEQLDGNTTFRTPVSTETQYVLTLERWETNSKKIVLTTNDAVDKIFQAIKEPDASTGFSWSRFKEYYPDTYPFTPITIKFTNGVFVIQDIHGLYASQSNLTQILMYGSLTVWNGMNSFIQRSHENMHKFALDTGLFLNMQSNNCYAKLGAYTSSNHTPYVYLRGLPLAH